MPDRLRIAIFVHEFPALSETFVLNQVTGLIELGHDVTIFAVRPRDEPIVHADVHRFDLLSRTHYLSIPAGRARRAALALALLGRRDWSKIRLLLRSLKAYRYGIQTLSLRLFFWTDLLSREAPFDIVHCHFGPIGQLASMVRDIGALEGHLVTVFHGVDISAYVRNRPRFYDFLFRHGDLFLPISQAWCRKIVDLGCERDRIRVHRMGIDMSRYPFRQRHFPEGSISVLSIGRMVEKKGLEYGLRAMAQLVTKHEILIRYTIVGDGPLRRELEVLTEELGLSSSVSFLGWQEQAAIARLMNENDILLAPSVTSADGDQEGIPVTLMEAMACGMIVVSTDHTGIPELVAHERSGLLVRERDIDGLVVGILSLCHRREIWPSMSKAAHDAVADGFEITKLNERLSVDFYRLRATSPLTISPRSAVPAERATIASN